jgi:hypothetical protein
VRIAAWLAAPSASLILLAGCSAASPGATRPSAGGTTPTSGSPYSVRIGPYTQVYATPLPANSAQARVIAGFRTAQILWGRSNEALRPVAPVTDYVTGSALTDMNAALTAGRQNDYVPSGIERFFDTKVAQISSSAAKVTTCDDGSKYFTKDLSTGRELPHAPGTQLYLFEIWDMVPLSGHWAIAAFNLITLPDRRAAACQP